jgi:hypothetical protein
MNMGTTLTFHLPDGWTLRRVATAMAREWLPPFRAVPVVKAAPWMVQPVVDESETAAAPLWEPGITTEEYEERLNHTLRWSIRAKAGRGKGTILARLAMTEDDAATFQMVCAPETFPETLFDSTKLAEFMDANPDGLFVGLLTGNGFELASA